jgi:cyanophycinase-like exopeptidase
MIVDKVTADAPVLVAELAGADIVYLPGGNPTDLLESLHHSAAWKQLLEMADDGVVLAGSSAGAMVFGERMAFGGGESEALGLVAGVTVLPHFERANAERVDQLIRAAPAGMTYLGIDGATGCLRVNGEWRVTGPGRVQVITKDGAEAVESGGVFQLP